MTTEGNRSYRILQVAEDLPSLVWAAWRMLDAGRRAHELAVLVEDKARAWKSHLQPRARLDDVAGTVTLDFPGLADESRELAREATPVVSEVLLHTRAALDYCVYHGAWIDSGTRNESTQFLLEDTRASWARKARGQRLRGLTAEHVAWVEEVQPYRGVEWSAQLRRLSNQDKHRLPVMISAAPTVTLDTGTLEPDPYGEPGFTGFRVIERTLDLLIVQDPVRRDGDESPVIPVLWTIIAGAVAVVNRFLTGYGEEPLTMTEAPGRR